MLAKGIRVFCVILMSAYTFWCSDCRTGPFGQARGCLRDVVQLWGAVLPLYWAQGDLYRQCPSDPSGHWMAARRASAGGRWSTPSCHTKERIPHVATPRPTCLDGGTGSWASVSGLAGKRAGRTRRPLSSCSPHCEVVPNRKPRSKWSPAYPSCSRSVRVIYRESPFICHWRAIGGSPLDFTAYDLLTTGFFSLEQTTERLGRWLTGILARSPGCGRTRDES